jgi:signal peptidase I
VGRKGSHAAWLLFPLVNIFIYAGLCVDLVRSFGKFSFWDSALSVIYAPVSFFLLGNKKENKYLGPTLTAEREYVAQLHKAKTENNAKEFQRLDRNNPYKKSGLREWSEAIIFAVFAAAFIRMFLIEAYTIPTSSMEGSLKVGDFLFVSKAHYGIRTPQTILMVPLLHNRIPIINRESYISKPNLPFFRLPSLTTIKRYDPVVFNYPEGDSVYVFPERTWSIHDFRRGSIDPQRFMAIRTKQAELVERPIDKKDHYIKRCIGIPGDSLQIINRQVFVNGNAAQNPQNMQFLCRVISEGGSFNVDKLADWGVNLNESNPQQGIFFLDSTQIEKIHSMGSGIRVELLPQPPSPTGHFFPHDEANFPGWSVDNYGPIYIPKKGATVQISPQNITLYRRIIGVYEGNKLEEKDGKIFINGNQATSYTFKMNYYWMMGDNRHNSEDSRVWGFVPDDHIVGKPLFIWFSTKNGNMLNGINWNRIFTTANKM